MEDVVNDLLLTPILGMQDPWMIGKEMIYYYWVLQATGGAIVVGAIGAVVGAIVALAGHLLTLRNTERTLETQIRSTERTLETQIRNTDQTLEANRKGQIAERFIKAVDHLGNDKIEVRIGGIYALERITKEEPKEYYWPIIEILTSYVRTRAKPSLVSKEMEEDDDDRRHQHPLPDVQAALYVLARRNRDPDLDGTRFINLSNTDLRNGDVRGANLKEARMRRVNLKGAILRDVVFEGAVLSDAHLEETKLERAIFTGATLRRAVFTNADLDDAVFTKANLRSAQFTKADLSSADLREAKNLTQGQLDEAYGNDQTKVSDPLKPPPLKRKK